MIKIGITGKNGFVGTHLAFHIGLLPEEFVLIDFERSSFEDHELLCAFVSSCDVIIHLAALNRHTEAEVIFKTNIDLVTRLIAALNETGSKPHLIFASSLQEEQDNAYGKSKKIGRELLANWAKESDTLFTGLIVPNVFGPFGKPFYNSFIATFSHLLTRNQHPVIDEDRSVQLMYVGELAELIVKLIREKTAKDQFEVLFTKEIKVSEVLGLLSEFKNSYFDNGILPDLDTTFKIQLFNTFRSFIELKTHYPVRFKKHTDNRGSFVELLRLETGGQVSFSSTLPGITRGNHFHTRKIERFAVISGEARIQLRKIGTSEKLDFHLSSDAPSYVDMPIWYTHNITNIGKEELLTVFWINEFYRQEDPDTFFEEV